MIQDDPRCVFQEIKSGFNLVTSPREGSTGRESSVSVISLCISVYLGGAFREDQTWQLLVLTEPDSDHKTGTKNQQTKGIAKELHINRYALGL